ncbi:ovochymase-2-like isoform X2 [Dermacentor albipictus]|uniref:ovochymase-2-like isoform X2 n=1 Tax=Dermacentor albipictus TaxID=60249 RepID=UPI0038FC0E92
MYNVISLSQKDDSIELVRFGATLTSWKVDGKEMLFLSDRSLRDSKSPIRGGIPLVFPNFGAWELGPHHGFAHTSEWTVQQAPAEEANGDKAVILSLQDNDYTRSIWNHGFQLLYRVALRKAQLHLELSVENKGTEAFEFTALLHPYWRTADVRQCTLSGCHGVVYTDKTRDVGESREEREYVTVSQWTDNVYKSTEPVHKLTGVGAGKTLTIEKENLPDTAAAHGATLRDGANLLIRGEASGYLQTPGFALGQRTPNGFRGAATIYAPPGYSRLRLDFDSFDLETSSQCKADWVSIEENRTRTRILCSSSLPPPYLSSSSAVTVFLATDKMRSSRGFLMRFSATNSRGVNRWSRQLARNTECGRPTVQPDVEVADRIVGGQEAVPHSWPWQASIQMKSFWPAAHFCGGVLVRNDLVITAAHCVQGMRPENLVLKFGSHDLVRDDAGVQIRSVFSYATHNSYRRDDLTHDVAAIKLSLPVNYTARVRPVCLPGAGQQLAVNTTCFASGWGNTRGSGGSFSLKQARLVVRPFADACAAILAAQPSLDASAMVCAVDESHDAGPCHGDSGGPLVCRLEPSSAWTLVGMTSQGTAFTMTSALCGMGAGTIWSGVMPNRRWIDLALRTL